MARSKGTFQFAANFEVKAAAALDPRVAVNDKSELINKDTWPFDGDSLYVYDGMIVGVVSEQSLYMLIDSTKILDPQYSGWLKIGSKSVVEVTYSELKELRNSNKLNIGTYYHITDYVTTISDVNADSIQQPFGLVVMAISENTLSPQASVISKNNYFLNSQVDKWKVWYSLDNNLYQWANPNGKGVIYRMIDEFNNDCPYDFKNIRFTRSNSKVFTFDDLSGNDNSLTGNCNNNIIKPYKDLDNYYLNNIVISSPTINDIEIQTNCHHLNIQGSLLENIKLLSRISGNPEEILDISISKHDSDYLLKVAYNSQKQLCIYCDADLVIPTQTSSKILVFDKESVIVSKGNVIDGELILNTGLFKEGGLVI